MHIYIMYIHTIHIHIHIYNKQGRRSVNSERCLLFFGRYRRYPFESSSIMFHSGELLVRMGPLFFAKKMLVRMGPLFFVCCVVLCMSGGTTCLTLLV